MMSEEKIVYFTLILTGVTGRLYVDGNSTDPKLLVKRFNSEAESIWSAFTTMFSVSKINAGSLTSWIDATKMSDRASKISITLWK